MIIAKFRTDEQHMI